MLLLLHAEGCDKLRREFKQAWDVCRCGGACYALVGWCCTLQSRPDTTPCNVVQRAAHCNSQDERRRAHAGEAAAGGAAGAAAAAAGLMAVSDRYL
jgi:hypothetical protein